MESRGDWTPLFLERSLRNILLPLIYSVRITKNYLFNQYQANIKGTRIPLLLRAGEPDWKVQSLRRMYRTSGEEGHFKTSNNAPVRYGQIEKLRSSVVSKSRLNRSIFEWWSRPNILGGLLSGWRHD